MAQKQKKVTESVDLAPVELDPPDPALARWQELADRDIDIYHDGDAEKVIPFPRPAWADPDRDDIAGTWQGSCYRSAVVEIASMSAGGHNDDESLRPAHFTVTARIHGNGYVVIGVLTRRFIDDEWREWGGSIHPAGALELADALRAAVDMVGGAE